MEGSIPWIVMRSRNDSSHIEGTLAALADQDHPFRLLSMDNASVDGTAERVRARAQRSIPVAEGTYVPGRVLNRGMEATEGEIVIFLNADCTPVGRDWVRRMVEPFQDPAVMAAFGRQEPRPGCHPLLARDTRETFGDGSRQGAWRHCFSMAASAVRRSAWELHRFDESLTYSEDIDWSWRVRQAGGELRYVPGAVVLHSHDYSLLQFYRRHRGEGQAEARIFSWDAWRSSWWRYSLLPFTAQVFRDLRHTLSQGDLASAAWSPLLRMAQMTGRRAGFLAGRRNALETSQEV